MLVLTRVCFFSESCLLYNHVIIEEHSPMHSRQHIKTVECSLMLLLTRVCFYSESLFDVYYRVMMEEYSSMHGFITTHTDGGLFPYDDLYMLCLHISKTIRIMILTNLNPHYLTML